MNKKVSSTSISNNNQNIYLVQSGRQIHNSNIKNKHDLIRTTSHSPF